MSDHGGPRRRSILLMVAAVLAISNLVGGALLCLTWTRTSPAIANRASTSAEPVTAALPPPAAFRPPGFTPISFSVNDVDALSGFAAVNADLLFTAPGFVRAHVDVSQSESSVHATVVLAGFASDASRVAAQRQYGAYLAGRADTEARPIGVRLRHPDGTGRWNQILLVGRGTRLAAIIVGAPSGRSTDALIELLDSQATSALARHVA